MRLQGDLGKDNVGKLLWTLSLPAMIGMTVQAMYNVVNTFWVGGLGSKAIAALTICFPIQMIMIAVAGGTGIGLSSIISRRLGEQKDTEASNAALHGILLIGIYGILVTSLGIIFLNKLLYVFGATPELFTLSRDYIRIILMGSILLFFAVMSGAIIQAQGNSGTPMRSMLTGAIINVILDPFFIFGIGPFPRMGVSGAALATLIAQTGACSINFRYLCANKGILKLSRKDFKFKIPLLTDIYKVGFPSMVMQLMNSIIIVILNRILGSYSFMAIGAMGIFFRVQSLIFMPVMGLTQGLLPIVGYAFGSHRLDRMKLAIKKASFIAFIIMSAGFLAFQLIPTTLIGIFNNDPRLVKMGIECMKNISLLLPLVGPSIVMSSTFQAVGKGFTALWLSLLRQVILLLPAVIILRGLLGLRGIWLAFPVSDLLSISITFIVLLQYIKKLDISGFPGRGPVPDMIKEKI